MPTKIYVHLDNDRAAFTDNDIAIRSVLMTYNISRVDIRNVKETEGELIVEVLHDNRTKVATVKFAKLYLYNKPTHI